MSGPENGDAVVVEGHGDSVEAGNIVATRQGPGARRVKLYDFKRPDKFSREQLRTIQLLSESFSRMAAQRYSAELRLPCDIKLDYIDQLTYGEFIDSVQSPSLYAISGFDPIKGNIVVHIDAVAADAFCERLFGARPVATDRPLALGGVTDIEYVALEGLIQGCLEDLGSAWSFIPNLKPRLAQVETEARFCQIVPPQEMIVLSQFSISIGVVQGKLRIVYPFLVLEPVLHMLSARYWYSSKDQRTGSGALSAAYRAPLPAEIVQDALPVSLGRLKSLVRGARLPLGQRYALRLGGTDVAELKAPEYAGGLCSAAVIDNGGADVLLAGSESPEDASAALARELREGLSGLKASLGESFSRLGQELESLKHRQDDLSDRVLFGQADAEEPAGQRKPFASLSGTQAEGLAVFLANERPQVCALILSFLDDVLASRVLSLLPASAQPDIALRIARLDWTSPAVLAKTDKVLGRKLAAGAGARMDAGGVAKVVELLNLSSREVEKEVICALEKTAPDVAEAIKQRMFVFEDLCLLDRESMKLVLESSQEEDVLLALKPVSPEVRELLFKRFPEGLAARYKSKLEALGRVRLRDCEEAGQRVVAVVKALEEEGRIIIVGLDGPE